MTSKAKDSYGSEAVEPGAETQEQDRLLDSTRGDKIRRRAYEIYLERGSEPGRELEDWLQAERVLTTEADQSSNRPLAGKAVTYKALGGPEVIEYVERTVRAPAAGEVRIEVKAAAVNPVDLMFRDPGWPNMTSNIVPGMDAAGVIESVGPGVSRLQLGQKVIAAVNPVRPEGGVESIALSKLFTGPAGFWSFAGQLTQPLYAGSSLRGAVRLSEAQKDQAVLTYQQTIQRAFQEVSDALIAYAKDQEFRKQQELLTNSAQDASLLSNLRYRGGAASYLEVLDAETRQYSAELTLAQARLNEMLDYVQLYHALGGGWEQ